MRFLLSVHPSPVESLPFSLRLINVLASCETTLTPDHKSEGKTSSSVLRDLLTLPQHRVVWPALAVLLSRDLLLTGHPKHSLTDQALA